MVDTGAGTVPAQVANYSFDPTGTAQVESRTEDGQTWWWWTTVVCTGSYIQAASQLQINVVRFGFERCNNVLMRLAELGPWSVGSALKVNPSRAATRYFNTAATATTGAQEAALRSGWSHRHRDVSGGWLRPTVFGAVDGLVTNASLIAGVGGVGGSAHTIVLTGLAGLVAGAFSMGTGEYVSVTNQNELVHAEVAVERRMHQQFPAAEQAELTETFRSYGADPQTAARMSAAVSKDPEVALRFHTREELGMDAADLPSPLLAGGASLVAFSFGAVLPLLPYLLGWFSLPTALAVAAVALLILGAVVGRLTGRPILWSAARQLLLGAVAVAVTFAVGQLIGAPPK